MSILIIGTTVAAIVLLYAISRQVLTDRSTLATHTGTHALDMLTDKAMPRPSEGVASVPPIWRTMTVNSLAAAEELLDCADSAGYAEREMIVLGNSTFLVRWR